jgi:hypothetical protein
MIERSAVVVSKLLERSNRKSSHGDNLNTNGSVVGRGLEWLLGYRGTSRFPRLTLCIHHYFERDSTMSSYEHTNQAAELGRTFAFIFDGRPTAAITKQAP